MVVTRAALLSVLVSCSSGDKPVKRDIPLPTPGDASIPVADPVVRLSSGDGEVCATRASGRAFCWGGGNIERAADAVHLAASDAITVVPGHRCVQRRDGMQCNEGPAVSGVIEISEGCAIRADNSLACVGPHAPAWKRVTRVVSSWFGGCAIVDERVRCWGIRDRARDDLAVDKPIDLHLRLRASGACALEAGGALVCWGEHEHRHHRVFPVTRTTALGAIRRLAPSGVRSLCVLRKTGEVACWPVEALVEILDGKTAEPRTIAADERDPWIDVVENCALRKSGRVFCWGDNSRGQVTGIGDVRERPTRVAQPARTRVFGTFHDDPWCAVIDDGSVVCWPASADRPALRLPAPQSDEVVQIVPAIFGACALLRSGRVMCWVHGDSQGYSTLPYALPGIEDATVLASSVLGRICAVRKTGQVSCGYASPDSGNALTPVKGIDDAIAIACSIDYACAVRASGRVRCWGTRHWNGSSIVDTAHERAFEPPGLPPMSQIAVPRRGESASYVCGIDRNKAVWCWGRPSCLERACRVTGAKDVVALAAGLTAWGGTGYHAVDTNGRVLSWTDEREEVSVHPDVVDAVGIRAGTSATCVIHRDDTVSCWGYVGERLNDGHRTLVTAPVEVLLD